MLGLQNDNNNICLVCACPPPSNAENGGEYINNHKGIRINKNIKC